MTVELGQVAAGLDVGDELQQELQAMAATVGTLQATPLAQQPPERPRAVVVIAHEPQA